MRGRKKLPLETLQPYLLDPLPDPPRRWTQEDLCALFGRQAPVELEIGFGKGFFLVCAAQARPEVNYLGVEIDRGLELYVAGRIAKRGLRNVRLIRADARVLVRDYLADDVLAAMHVYFPDPWWKKRHAKRRLFSPEFARQCARVLVPGGALHIASDVEDYFGAVCRSLRDAGLEEQPPVAWPEQWSQHVIPAPDMQGYLSNFARKAALAGRPVRQARFVKLGS